MLAEQQQQARSLYFQTNLSKTQIAEILNVSRRSLHYWIRENNWDRLKTCAAQMPSIIAEDCYHIMANFSKHLLSETRMTSPISHQEADTLHKLTLTINKLKNRSTLNESMEMFGFFMERVTKKSPDLAKAISPFVEDYIISRASVSRNEFMPENFNQLGYIPVEQEDNEEAKLDIQDVFAWSDTDKQQIDVEQLRSVEDPVSANPDQTWNETQRRSAIMQTAAEIIAVNSPSPLPVNSPAQPQQNGIPAGSTQQLPQAAQPQAIVSNEVAELNNIQSQVPEAA